MTKTIFQTEVNKILPEHRCIQTDSGRFRNYPLGDCFFGVPSSMSYGREALSDIPEDTTGFHFYLGSEQQALFDTYLDSKFPAQTKSLYIGNSSYDLGKGDNYLQLTASLFRGHFPQLETLELGVWQLFSNSHCIYGQVGKIDALSDNMPNLKYLGVYGNYQLHAPLSLPHLERLRMVVDDPVTGINGGALDQTTVTNLFRSSFPRLDGMYIDLNINDELETNNTNVSYTLPDEFLTGDLMPNVTKFELTGTFRSGERRRLLSSSFLQRPNLGAAHLQDMVESTADDDD